MTDCPNCEYHRQRAQLWRDEAYKQAGHPLPEREKEYHAVNAVHKGQQCYVKTQTEQDSGIVTAGGFDPRTQRTWVGLTYEEQRELYKKHEMDGWGHFYNAIEAKLKEKNGL